MNRLEEIKEREAKATKGPWATNYPDDMFDVVVPHDRNYCLAEKIVNLGDAEFIANAREDIPWLISKVELLTALVDDEPDDEPGEEYMNADNGPIPLELLMAEARKLK